MRLIDRALLLLLAAYFVSGSAAGPADERPIHVGGHGSVEVSSDLSRGLDSVSGSSAHTSKLASSTVAVAEHSSDLGFKGSTHVAGSGSAITQMSGSASEAGSLASHTAGSASQAGSLASHMAGSASEAGGLASHMAGSASETGGLGSHMAGSASQTGGLASHMAGSVSEAGAASTQMAGSASKAGDLASHMAGSLSHAGASNTQTAGSITKEGGFDRNVKSHLESVSNTKSGVVTKATGSATPVKIGLGKASADTSAVSHQSAPLHGGGVIKIGGGVHAASASTAAG